MVSSCFLTINNTQNVTIIPGIIIQAAGSPAKVEMPKIYIVPFCHGMSSRLSWYAKYDPKDHY